nr:immunoglobulin heavy chain junction region [Mus musculus]NSM03677.1 immunoglobulin heavy chain junction region [Mus musculus]NSM03706.1 immunoglobulin heavy chain junction region [Mus musculus]NSM03738.1 immunoglobulin heavy chain junction region [Mus musculus]NSM03743.1 immunoglobulin heavy chain junction region [Mus musculus]
CARSTMVTSFAYW